LKQARPGAETSVEFLLDEVSLEQLIRDKGKLAECVAGLGRHESSFFCRVHPAEKIH
jgi:hypothetical protein